MGSTGATGLCRVAYVFGAYHGQPHRNYFVVCDTVGFHKKQHLLQINRNFLDVELNSPS